MSRPTKPYYSTLSAEEIALLAKLIRTNGFASTIGALADILTQEYDGYRGAESAPDFSLQLGVTMSIAEKFDKERQGRP